MAKGGMKGGMKGTGMGMTMSESDYGTDDCNHSACQASVSTARYKKATDNQSTDYETNLSDKYIKSQVNE